MLFESNKVTRGSLADEKHPPALTILSSASLDKAFFLTFSLLPQNFPEEFSCRFPTPLKGLFWKYWNTDCYKPTVTSLDMKGGTFKAIRLREYMIEATWQYKMNEVEADKRWRDGFRWLNTAKTCIFAVKPCCKDHINLHSCTGMHGF